MAAILGINIRTQTFWDGSKQPNILQIMARAHSLAARRLAQDLSEEIHREGRGIRSEADSVCGRTGDNRS